MAITIDGELYASCARHSWKWQRNIQAVDKRRNKAVLSLKGVYQCSVCGDTKLGAAPAEYKQENN